MKFPEFQRLNGSVSIDGRTFAVLVVPEEYVGLFAALAKTIETVGPDAAIVTHDVPKFGIQTLEGSIPADEAGLLP